MRLPRAIFALMRTLILAATFLLAACASRPLTSAEDAFIGTVMGDEIDTSSVRLTRGAVVGLFPVEVPPRPRVTCQERLFPPRNVPVEGVIPAFVLYERMYVTREFWSDDFLAGYPGRLSLDEAMRLAHELTHVWQWQQRARTGYRPIKAVREHRFLDDPYLFENDDPRPFLDYGYEQQGSIVEEFVCCRALDPDGARTERLRNLVAEAFPAAARRESVPMEAITLPWPGAETKGICS